MSNTEVKEALCINEAETNIVLETDRQSQENFVEHDLHPEKVDLQGIANSLGLPETDFSAWAEDNMIFILYGQNISDGIVGEGPTARLATAAFYARWYEEQKKGRFIRG